MTFWQCWHWLHNILNKGDLNPFLVIICWIFTRAASFGQQFRGWPLPALLQESFLTREEERLGVRDHRGDWEGWVLGKRCFACVRTLRCWKTGNSWMCSPCVFTWNNSCLRSCEVIIGESKMSSTYGHSVHFYLSMTTNGLCQVWSLEPKQTSH